MASTSSSALRMVAGEAGWAGGAGGSGCASRCPRVCGAERRSRGARVGGSSADFSKASAGGSAAAASSGAGAKNASSSSSSTSPVRAIGTSGPASRGISAEVEEAIFSVSSSVSSGAGGTEAMGGWSREPVRRPRPRPPRLRRRRRGREAAAPEPGSDGGAGSGMSFSTDSLPRRGRGLQTNLQTLRLVF